MDNFIMSYELKIWVIAALLWILSSMLTEKFTRKYKHSILLMRVDTLLLLVGVIIFAAFFILISYA